MATLVLSAAGSFAGSALLPEGLSILGAEISGAALGSAIGAGLGAYVDAKLFGPTIAGGQGPRLKSLQVMASSEGAPVPRLYGRARLAGQVIWATQYKEHSSTTSSGGGGKGGGGSGTSYTSYSYSVSLAVALAEGPVTRIGRVWADGNLLDLSTVSWRLNKGEETQEVDPLIEAVEGAAPAYRGIAYVVFEDLNLAPFGNRVPQFSFEVFKTLSAVEGKVRAVNIIPGAGEFIYSPTPEREWLTEASSRAVNTHTSLGASDWSVAIDQLQATCENVEAAALVVTWFGDDLRCGACTIRPKVEVAKKVTRPDVWQVAGLTRATATLVSRVDGRPAYGGTPSDKSVVAAIKDMKARGLNVTLYPFVMMDISADNTKPDPWSDASSQPPYPWRGRIAVTPDAEMTGDATSEVASFFGTASASHFHIAGGGVSYTGPSEWSYRRMILHNAALCAAAGGVDAFLIGSEMRALTWARSASGIYPAVAALKSLAAEVATILSDTKISYAADWSEFVVHAPDDGSGDMFFHLDPLWADANIHFVGIDNYAPLSDWRDGAGHLDLALSPSIYDIDYLKSRIAGGENFDWYYASEADRETQTRTAITDGAYGKPWVWRAKDLVSWWGQAHYNRPGGIESATPTDWLAQGKPIVFTEIGCPTIDKGANQPNVFFDPKSSESAAPYFSKGTRDDFIQRVFIEAQMDYWSETGAHNPVSSVYDGPMLDPAQIFFWCWDARPFPSFPDLVDVWSDGETWPLGHWLNGRMGAAPLSDLVTAIMADVDFGAFDVSALTDTVDGFVIDRVMSVRDALAPLMLARFFDASESEGVIRFQPFGDKVALSLTPDLLAVASDSAQAGYTLTRAQETELPVSAKFTYINSGSDYQSAAVESRRLSVRSQRVASTDLPIVLSQDDGQSIADIWLQKTWVERETLEVTLPPSRLALDPGDVLELVLGNQHLSYRLTGFNDAGERTAKGVRSEASLFAPIQNIRRPAASTTATNFGTPLVVIMDLPLLSGAENPYAPRIGVAADPWPGGVAVYKSIDDGVSYAFDRTVTRQTVMGRLGAALGPGVTSRWDWSQSLEIDMAAGTLTSATKAAVLAGANLAAIEAENGEWEVIQFRQAELVAPETYVLRGLLRGQAGTELAMAAGAAVAARFVLLDNAIAELSLDESERGLPRLWACGPQVKPLDDASYTTLDDTFFGIALRPLSPVHVKAARDVGGDITIDWIRRTRAGGDNWENVDVPLGEEEERYVIDIMSGASVLRSLDATTSSVIYDAAMQTSDFGSTSFSTLSVRVAQISRVFGRGSKREAILHV